MRRVLARRRVAVAMGGLAEDDDALAGEDGAQRLEVREVAVVRRDRAQGDRLGPQPGDLRVRRGFGRCQRRRERQQQRAQRGDGGRGAVAWLRIVARARTPLPRPDNSRKARADAQKLAYYASLAI